MTEQPINVVILGAAGRDFHDFNVYYKNNARYRVVAFTATQIPDIEGRVYPPELAGERYPEGIPIHAEDDLTSLIEKHAVRECCMSYSDLPHEEVMHKAAIVNAAGADFKMLGRDSSMLVSDKPVIAICAVRTGCGKSQTSRRVNEILKEMGKKVATVRHPMPYGDLMKQVWQRFATFEDMDSHECTIEEREEYEPHIAMGNIVYAGVDYGRILQEAQKEADVILWDGGNNDLPFYKPDLFIVVADPHRPGHEMSYYPGETNARMADIVIINKIGTANPADVDAVENNIHAMNNGARVIRAHSPVTVDDPAGVRGKRVLVVEDGPTLTHGEMTFGAGHVAAREFGAAVIVDPRPHAVGSIKETFDKYSHLSEVLPAMGYGKRQISELESTINAVDCDLVLIGTPIDLSKLLKIEKPYMRVRYELDEEAKHKLAPEVEKAVRGK
jgi:predicted GTPase